MTKFNLCILWVIIKKVLESWNNIKKIILKYFEILCYLKKMFSYLLQIYQNLRIHSTLWKKDIFWPKHKKYPNNFLHIIYIFWDYISKFFL